MADFPYQSLSGLFEQHFGVLPETISPLPPSGSDRKYFRLQSSHYSAIGAWSADAAENRTFISFAKTFHQHGIAVPELFAVAENDTLYLQTDLGDENLLDRLLKEGLTPAVKNLYTQSLLSLIEMQTIGKESIDPGLILGATTFSPQAMFWDLNYFKYCFLKTSGAKFDEAKLEADFQSLVHFLSAADNSFFMHRDFQARNLMVSEGKTWIIDFQGGRKGPLAYDVASLLFQAKANLPADFRAELISFYLDHQPAVKDRNGFQMEFDGFVLLRVLQTLGAYGLRGNFERKKHFIDSIPFAVANAIQLLESKLPIALPEIHRALLSIPTTAVSAPSTEPEKLPEDTTGHGSGFVFDCRFIENPGRQNAYQFKTGLDAEVKEFLESKTVFPKFIDSVFVMIDDAVAHYLERGFKYLTVNFGCTGGQHRSVASAEALAAHLKNKFPVDVVLEHTNAHNWKKTNGKL
jgi:aminoglycoside/choline kinase family phosphotransferase